MDKEVQVKIEKSTGIIALNRPKAINALNFEMIKAIDIALSEFEENPKINGVLLKSAHERGFCAGGDIRLARQNALDSKIEEMHKFFAAEYALDGKIVKFSKPIVVLTDGIVMGGGLGLAGHAKYRITTSNSRFAMPEAAIGFVCDCGIDAILAKVERHIALAFLMSGEVVGANDALALGLSDCIINKSSIKQVENELIKAMNSTNINSALKEVMRMKNIKGNETPFIEKANSCKQAFLEDNILEIMNKLKQLSDGNHHAKSLFQRLIKLCPTSLAAILISHDKARQDSDVDKVLNNDFLLATFMAAREDFVEGVRAVVIDKDQNPNWQPDDLNNVNIDKIHAIIA